MKTLFLSTILSIFSMTVLFAQLQIDTIGMAKRKFSFTYKEELVKKPKVLESILLQEPIDPQVKSQWSEYKTLHTLSLGIGTVGIGIMAVDLIQTLQGNESSTLMLAGAGTLLAGAIFDGFVATPRAKEAARSYNNFKLGRKPPISPPSLKDQVDTISGRPAPGNSNLIVPKDPPSLTRSNPDKYFGFSFGTGWSKQKINYEFALNRPYHQASVLSFAAHFGNRISEKLAWQIELGLTEHGYREKLNVNSNGVRVNVKADAQVRYLELPVLMVYQKPLGNKGLEVAALGGISPGYALSAKAVAVGQGENETRKVNTKVSDKVSLKNTEFTERLDAALLFGGQAIYPVGPGYAFVEARYHFGVLNLERSTEFSITEEGDKAYNRSLFLRVGYRHAL